MIYLIAFSFVTVFSFIEAFDKKFPRIGFYSGIAIIFIVALFKGEVGADYSNYHYFWVSLPSSLSVDALSKLFEYRFEPGFVITSMLVKSLGDSFLLFNLLVSCLILLPMAFGLKKIGASTSIVIACYLGVFYMTYMLSGVRQAVSMSFFLFSLPLIIKNENIKVLLIAIVASLFHLSGVLIAVGLLSYKFFFIRKYWFFFVIVSMLVGYLGIVSDLFFNIFPDKQASYVEIFSEEITPFNILTRLALLVLFIYGPRFSFCRSEYYGILNVYIVGVCLYFLLMQNAELATRFNMFFRVLELPMFSLLIYSSSFFINRISLLVIALIPISYIFFQNASEEVNRYSSIFS